MVGSLGWLGLVGGSVGFVAIIFQISSEMGFSQMRYIIITSLKFLLGPFNNYVDRKSRRGRGVSKKFMLVHVDQNWKKNPAISESIL